ncbi:MAG: TonB-dependent receptor [Flavisolibacter sp.]|nr:TonB-dependent receptor [Flavisolibacter sp.]
MRIALLFLLASLTAFGVHAQQISGATKDAEGKPLNGATISLLKDTTVIKLAATRENGLYSFVGVREGTYRIKATFVGHTPAVSAPFEVAQLDITVPDLQLTKAAGDLKGVTITAQKPIVEVKADKTILNVEGTVNAVGSDALELLRKSPGVMVDKDDNLTVSGKNGVQVYIDGRPTPLAGQDLANYLKTLQSSQIEAIEIITNPSAKYEAAGNAGIINIRLKKNRSYGTNGSVNAGFNVGVYPKYNTGFSLNHRNKNINIYGNYNYNNSKNQNKLNLYRTVLDTLFDQHSSTLFTNNSHNFKGGIDYTLNKKSTIGVIVNGNFSDPFVTNHSRTPIIYKPTSTTSRILVADNETDMKRNNVNVNLNYNYTGTDGKSLVLNADHGYYDISSNQLQPNVYYDVSGQNKISSVTYQMIAPTTINISSLKADYERNFAKGKLGVGGKIAFINADNDFQRYDVVQTGKVLDRDRSNQFEYNENINAGYVNYNRALKGLMIQAGLRVENTNTEGISNGMKNNGSDYVKYRSGFKRSYTDFFPSAAITFNKNPMKQWNFTYSRRIDRPAYQDLNPFEFKLDEYTFQKGNTELRPQYTNSFGITHTYKYKLNATLNYSHVKDIFTMLLDTAEKSKSFISKKNLATQDIVSLNVSYPFIYKNFTSFVNANTFYSQYNADFGEGRTIDLNTFALSLYSQNTLKFGKTKAWTAEVTGFYNSPAIWQGAFRSKTLWSVDAGMQRQIMKGKGTVKASVSDIFHTLQFTGITDFAGQHTRVNAQWESRQLKLNFTYRFGNNQVKAARQRNTGAEEENKRTQGGGGIGIGQ